MNWQQEFQQPQMQEQEFQQLQLQLQEQKFQQLQLQEQEQQEQDKPVSEQTLSEPILQYEGRDRRISSVAELLSTDRCNHTFVEMKQLSSPVLPTLPFLIKTDSLFLNIGDGLWKEYAKFFDPVTIKRLEISTTRSPKSLFLKTFREDYPNLKFLSIESPKFMFTIDCSKDDFELTLTNTGNPGLLTVKNNQAIKTSTDEDGQTIGSLTVRNMEFGKLPTVLGLNVINCIPHTSKKEVRGVINFTSLSSFKDVNIVSNVLKQVEIDCNTEIVSTSEYSIVVKPNDQAFTVNLSNAPQVTLIDHKCWNGVEYVLNEECSAKFESSGLIPLSAFLLRADTRMKYKATGKVRLEKKGKVRHGIQSIKYFAPVENKSVIKDILKESESYTPSYLPYDIYGSRIDTNLHGKTVECIVKNYYPCPKILPKNVYRCVYQDTADTFCNDYSNFSEWTWMDSMKTWRQILVEQEVIAS